MPSHIFRLNVSWVQTITSPWSTCMLQGNNGMQEFQAATKQTKIAYELKGTLSIPKKAYSHLPRIYKVTFCYETLKYPITFEHNIKHKDMFSFNHLK